MRLDWRFIGLLTAAAAVVLILWPSPFVYPVRLFVTLVHELSHALATIATGGQVDAIEIFVTGGGVTRSRGGNLFLIASAGYLGSLLFGGLLLALAKQRGSSRRSLQVLAAILLLAGLIFVRNLFGFAATLTLAALLWVTASLAPAWLQRFAMYLLGALNCIYAFLDLTGLYALAAMRTTTDAELMARATGIPAVAWATVWLAAGTLALFALARQLVRS